MTLRMAPQASAAERTVLICPDCGVEMGAVPAGLQCPQCRRVAPNGDGFADFVRFDLVGVAVAMASAWGAYALFINWSAGLLIDSLNLVSYALVGGALMGGLLATLRLAGPIQAWVYLFAVAGSAAWYLTRLLEINWRTVPSSARACLHAGSRG